MDAGRCCQRHCRPAASEWGQEPRVGTVDLINHCNSNMALPCSLAEPSKFLVTLYEGTHMGFADNPGSLPAVFLEGRGALSRGFW